MPFPLRVVSVEEQLFEGEADFVLASGEEGEVGLLPRHAPLLTTLRAGPLRIDSDGRSELLFVGGGFLEVLPDRVTVLADVAERAEDVSEERAEQARREARERLQGEVSPEEQRRLEQMLAHAEARLRLARIRQGRV
jgi:F-type H+-transporting ATPase subunit epsilon